MKLETVQKILNETGQGYDHISQKFSETRRFFWRGLEFIKDCAQDGDKILDFGCGNGRLLELFSAKRIDYTGADVSQKLLDLAKNKYLGEKINFLKIDAGQSSLPLEDNFFNSTYSIAVFHHFPREHAQKMAQELYRVTKPGGSVVVTVWNLWQKKYLKNIFRNWLQKIKGRSELDWNDCYISFQNNQGERFSRYHHAFTRRELWRVFADAGFLIEKIGVINKRNIILIGKKA